MKPILPTPTESRIDYLRRMLALADLIEQREKEEAARFVECEVCRDFYIVHIVYMNVEKNMYSRTAKCTCENSMSNKFIGANLPLLSTVLDKVWMVQCARCLRWFQIKDNEVKTRISGKPRETSVVCGNCPPEAMEAFNRKREEYRSELAALEPPAAVAPESLMEKMKRRLTHGAE